MCTCSSLTVGNLLWISAAWPAALARSPPPGTNLCARLRQAGLEALADLGFVGLDDASGERSKGTG